MTPSSTNRADDQRRPGAKCEGVWIDDHCHPERGEGSRSRAAWHDVSIPRCARDDSVFTRCTIGRTAAIGFVCIRLHPSSAFAARRLPPCDRSVRSRATATPSGSATTCSRRGSGTWWRSWGPAARGRCGSKTTTTSTAAGQSSSSLGRIPATRSTPSNPRPSKSGNRP